MRGCGVVVLGEPVRVSRRWSAPEFAEANRWILVALSQRGPMGGLGGEWHSRRIPSGNIGAHLGIGRCRDPR